MLYLSPDLVRISEGADFPDEFRAVFYTAEEAGALDDHKVRQGDRPGRRHVVERLI